MFEAISEPKKNSEGNSTNFNKRKNEDPKKPLGSDVEMDNKKKLPDNMAQNAEVKNPVGARSNGTGQEESGEGNNAQRNPKDPARTYDDATTRPVANRNMQRASPSFGTDSKVDTGNGTKSRESQAAPNSSTSDNTSNPESTQKSTEGDAKQCPEQFRPIGSKCLMMSSKNLTFGEAVSVCQSIGGKLAEPKTEEEARLLKKVGKGRNFWVGILDLQATGRFTYESNGLPTYQGFAPVRGKPNNFTDGDNGRCVRHMAREEKPQSGGNRGKNTVGANSTFFSRVDRPSDKEKKNYSKWADASCDKKMNFICEAMSEESFEDYAC